MPVLLPVLPLSPSPISRTHDENRNPDPSHPPPPALPQAAKKPAASMSSTTPRGVARDVALGQGPSASASAMPRLPFDAVGDDDLGLGNNGRSVVAM